MRWWWARTLQEWAKTHHLQGTPTDLERARTLYRKTLALYEGMGVQRYADLVKEAQRELRIATYREAEAHQYASQELAAAAHVQQGLLPEETPCIPGWSVAATLNPSKETSGDFYDFIPLSDGRLGIVVADVADKGAGAALYMALSRTLIRALAAEYPAQPEMIMRGVNDRILGETHTDMFVTAIFGVLDPASGIMSYSNAGHNPPYHFRAQGDQAPKALNKTGMPLGILPGANWEPEAIEMAPGDVLVLYSDGLTEAQNLQDELYGEGRLVKVVRANLGCSAEEIQDAVLEQVRQFVGSAP